MSTGTRISFGVYDTTAKDDVTTTTNASQSFSDMASVTQGDTVADNYGTFEANQCALDGSMVEFPISPQKMGIWSITQSGDDGVFSNPIIITFAFTQQHTSAGLTLHSNAKNIEVTWTTPTGDIIRPYTLDSEQFTLEFTAQNYTKIAIKVISTQTPNRFLRFYGIRFGLEYVFETKDIISCVVTEELTPTSEVISQNTCDFSISDKLGKFNMNTNSGAFPALQDSQKIVVERIVDGIRSDMGTFYLMEWDGSTAKQLSCKCGDVIGMLDGITLDGGFYNTTFGAFVNLILPFEFNLDTSLAAKSIIGWLPKGITARDALQHACIAVGATVDCSRSNIIKIKPMETKPSKLISKRVKYTGSTAKRYRPKTKLCISLNKYVPGVDTQELFNETLNGQVEIDFIDPVNNLSITGGTIIKSHVNYAVISGTGGTVVLTGTPYIKQSTTRNYPFPNLPANYNENPVKMETVYFVNSDNVSEVAQNVIAYHKNVIDYSCSMRLSDTHVGDIIVCEVDGGQIKGYAERQKIDLVRGSVATIDLYGVPLDDVTSQIYSGEVFTGEWGVV